MIGLRRIVEQREEDRADDGDVGVMKRHTALVERLEPTPEAADAPRVIGPLGQLRQEPRGEVDVAGEHRVLEGGLVVGVGSMPRRRAGMQCMNPRLVPTAQLGQEVVPKKVVVSVPLLAVVERDEEQVRAGEVIQPRGGVFPLHHAVAQRTAEPLEGGGIEQEAEVITREAAEDLGPDVIAEELIGQRARADRRRSVPCFRADRERRQVQAGGPALGAPVDRRDFLGGQIDAGGKEDRARIVIAELEIARVDQGPAPAGKDPGDRQAAWRPAGEHELRPAVQVARERNEHVGRIRLGEAIDIVEDQDKRGRLRRESGAEARHGHRPDRGTGRGQGFGHIRPERGGPAEREGDVGEEDRRIVVALVDRQPGEGPRIALGPLREERRLPVSGRRHDRDDRHLAARREPGDEGVSSQQAGARRWRDELRLENREAAGKQTDFGSGARARCARGRHRRVPSDLRAVDRERRVAQARTVRT